MKMLYELVVPSVRRIVGCFWIMRNTNVWVVQRTFGLFESLGNAGTDSINYFLNRMPDGYLYQSTYLQLLRPNGGHRST